LTDFIQKMLQEMPDFSHFLTIEELDTSSRELAAAYPDLVTLSTIGHSTEGHPILMLRIGNGQHRALFVGCPHPNEPIGALSLEYLSKKLCEDSTLLEQMDYTFYIIKEIDVDGCRLNEGWYGGPFSPDRYIRSYYRPGMLEQVEWTFPYAYKTFSFSEPIPETVAFMRAIDEAKPHFLNSLHSSDQTGTFYYVSTPLPDALCQQIIKLTHDHQLPLMIGEPEAPFMPPIQAGFYQLPELSSMYDYYQSILPTGEDPAKAILMGGSSLDYAGTRYRTFCLVSEISLFTDPRMGDKSETTHSYKDATLDIAKLEGEQIAFLSKQYQSAQAFITVPTRFQRSVEDFLIGMEEIRSHHLKSSESDAALARFATVAEMFDLKLRTLWSSLCCCSMLIRMLDAQPDNTTLSEIRADSEKWLDQGLQELLSFFNWSMRPLRELCGVQLGSALMIMEYLRQTHKSSATPLKS
jgi:Zinc carboxypeptidase